MTSTTHKSRRSPPRPNGHVKQTNGHLNGLSPSDDFSQDKQRSGALGSDMMLNGESDGGGQVSLAHELAAAMMPQPTTSRLLAEEFGLDFEDDEEQQEEPDVSEEFQSPLEDMGFASNAFEDRGSLSTSSPASSTDPLIALTKDLETMDAFISQLRHLDTSISSISPSSELPLEKAASELIRRLNDTVREREDQVRQLLELERELRRISVEVGGQEVLASLQQLDPPGGLADDIITENLPSQATSTASPSQIRGHHSRLSSLAEDQEEDYSNWNRGHGSRQASSSYGDPSSPTTGTMNTPQLSSNLPLSPPNGSTTPSSTLPHVAHLRTRTKSLAFTLTSLSEATQVNSAGATDAGRKIRSLKNKIGGWQAEWDSVERSRERIQAWESQTGLGTRSVVKQLVEEQMSGFHQALADAATKMVAIMGT